MMKKNMFRRPFPIIYLTGLLLGLSAGAQVEGGAAFRVRQWTTEDGLPQDRVACIEQSADGYLWMGTWFGLARFDGVHFTRFDHSNTPEFGGDRGDCINALAAERDGALWIATGNGVVEYRKGRFHRLGTNDGLPERAVWRAAAGMNGALWLLVGQWVTRFDQGRFHALWRSSVTNDLVTAIYSRDNGGLDVFTQNLWVTVSAGGSVRTNLARLPNEPFWRHALLLPDGKTLIATQSSLLSLAGDRLTRIDPPEWQSNMVNLLAQDKTGAIWADVHRQGLYRCAKNGWVKVNPIELGAAPVCCFKQDAEGSCWIGTDSRLVQLQPQPIRCYGKLEGVPDENTVAVCEDKDGAIWTSGEHVVSCLRRGSVTSFPWQDDSIYAICPNSAGGIWAACRSGALLQYSGGKMQPRIASQSSVNPAVIYQDSGGRIWMTGSEGVNLIDTNTFARSNLSLSLPALSDVRCVREDKAGGYWIGAGGGLIYLARQGGGWLSTNIFSQEIVSLCLDEQSNLWLVTGGGLSVLHRGRVFSFTTENGLPETDLNAVVADDRDGLWISGMRGIHRLRRSDWIAVAEGRRSKAPCLNFGVADGMDSPETNGGRTNPGGWKAHDGRIWFATSRGAVVIDPSEIDADGASYANPPVVVLESVQADGHPLLGGGTAAPAQIAPGRGHVLDFRYTANSFIDAQHVQFRYRLLGYDSSWRDAATERTVHYANLPPQAYRFEVMAQNHHGAWSARPAAFAFSIPPSFWQTWPFYSLCAVVLTGLIVGVQSYRLRWQKRFLKLEEQRTLANERARIARDLHDDFGTTLTGLALELDVLGREPGSSLVHDRLDRTARRVRGLVDRMREVVWTVNPSCDTVSSLAGFLEQQVEQFLRASHLNVRLEFPEDIPPTALGATERHQLALAVREALSNVVRHAHASEVLVSLAIDGSNLMVTVKDNGRGFEETNGLGDGLKNLRTRMESVGGTFECLAVPGSGSRLTFRLPLPPSHPKP